MIRFLIMVMLSAAFISSAAAQTGTVTGRVMINSEPADGAVVYLTVVDGRPLVAAPVERTIRQENIRFKPDFMIVPTGSVIRFENHDDEIHNIYSKAAENRFDTGAHVPHTVKTITLKNPGAVPIRCRTHSTMRGMIYVAPSPHFATTDELGRFRINDLPAGTYRIMAWHPRLSTKEQSEGAMNLELGAEARTVELRFTAKTGVGTDLTETAGRDWTPVVEQIREELDRAIGLWKKGSITAATSKVMNTHSRLYGESGLREAITQVFGKARAEEYERRFDALRKRVQGIGTETTTESIMKEETAALINGLMRDAEEMGAS